MRSGDTIRRRSDGHILGEIFDCGLDGSLSHIIAWRGSDGTSGMTYRKDVCVVSRQRLCCGVCAGQHLDRDCPGGAAPLAAIAAEAAEHMRKPMTMWPAMYNAHHGLGLLREEMHELEMEVFRKESQRDAGVMRAELLDVAGTAMRMIHDVIDAGRIAV